MSTPTHTRTYNNLPPSTIKRITNERNLINADRKKLEDEEEIYFWWDNTTINRTYLQLLVGPEDTPYEGGFFFFEARIPDQYPIQPMEMRALTQGMNFRQHPNYYICGKCCLSILNTWTGPPWSATLNMAKVAITMKSLYTTNPLNNEPGYSSYDISHPTCKAYEIMVEYWTLAVAVIEMLKNPPTGCEVFIPECKRLFIKYFDRYMHRIANMRSLNWEAGKTIYNSCLIPDKQKLEREFKEMYTHIKGN